MKSFAVELLVGETRYQLIFSRIALPKGGKFFIEAFTGQEVKYSFFMEQTAIGWKIVDAPKVPDEILHLQEQLSKLIEYQTGVLDTKTW